VHASIVEVFLRTGEWATADAVIERFLAHVVKHRLSTYHAVAVGWQGALAILRGDPSRGTPLLERALADLRADGYGLYIRPLSAALAAGYMKAGQHELAYAAICGAITWSEEHGPSTDLLELLHVKGEILISGSRGDAEKGEVCLEKSLELARENALLSMELRSGITLARLWAERGLARKGLALLAPIYERFTEGHGTSDLAAAGHLLTELRSRLTSGG